MQSMTVEILPIARDDVDQALTYIAVDNPSAADGLLADILDKLDQASKFPYSGTEIVLGTRRMRKYYRLYAHPYCIFYKVMEDRILVMRVLHERMDTQRYL